MHSTLLVQQFLRDHSLPALLEQFAVRGRRHAAFPNLVHLKYSQINSPMTEPIVRECRGLILDESDDWRAVSYPFDKFFNYGEPNAAAIDWGTAAVQEKLDGSLMILYWYADAWRVSSSGIPDAGGDVWGHAGTFADLFWETWASHGYALPVGAESHCFMFEMMTPFNRIVVPHQRSRLVCIGGRSLETYEEISAKTAGEKFSWESVRSFPLQTLDDVLTAAKVLSPTEAEGFVVVDAAFHRVKVKSPRYVALAHAKDSASPGKLLDLVRSGESAEMLSYFPELKAALDYVAETYGNMCDELERTYEAIRDLPDQRAFADAAKKTVSSSPLFAMRGGKAKSVREFFATATLQSVERAVQLDPAKVLALMGRAVGKSEVAE